MAKSLTVKHEEKLAPNWLFAGFLLFAVGWLLLSAFTAPPAEAVVGDEAIVTE